MRNEDRTGWFPEHLHLYDTTIPSIANKHIDRECVQCMFKVIKTTKGSCIFLSIHCVRSRRQRKWLKEQPRFMRVTRLRKTSIHLCSSPPSVPPPLPRSLWGDTIVEGSYRWQGIMGDVKRNIRSSLVKAFGTHFGVSTGLVASYNDPQPLGLLPSSIVMIYFL